ncbi:F0F1 ATP synthase subunit A [Thermodesulfobacteriota bacterium]
MQISPDLMVLWRFGFLELNGTILFTWVVMGVLVLGSWSVTRRLSTGVRIPRWQNLLESVVSALQQQLKEVTRRDPKRFLALLGTLFLFIAVSNILSVVPWFTSPTGSLSTTAGLALIVFLAVPAFSISEIGMRNYLGNYLRPTFFMLPFNIMGEFTRTLALAVRLFGNVMSGAMIGGILLAIAPLVFPVIMQLLGLLTGLVQAYIFAILAAVYIAAGMEVQKK